MTVAVGQAEKSMRLLRAQVLDNPACLLGMKEPPIEALWWYVVGLTEGIEIANKNTTGVWHTFIRERIGQRLGDFLRERGLGTRSAYQFMLMEHETFAERLKFMRDIFCAYDAWCLNEGNVA